MKFEAVSDYPGSPPLYLRMTRSGGQLRGEVGIDGSSYRPVGSELAVAALGGVKNFGILLSKRSRNEDTPAPPLRVFFIREDVK